MKKLEDELDAVNFFLHRKVNAVILLHKAGKLNIAPPPRSVFNVSSKPTFVRIGYVNLRFYDSFNLKYSLPCLIQVPVQKKCVFLF